MINADKECHDHEFQANDRQVFNSKLLKHTALNAQEHCNCSCSSRAHWNAIREENCLCRLWRYQSAWSAQENPLAKKHALVTVLSNPHLLSACGSLKTTKLLDVPVQYRTGVNKPPTFLKCNVCKSAASLLCQHVLLNCHC